MKLTREWDRPLRGAAFLALWMCALAWTGEVANASLFYLTSGASGSKTPLASNTSAEDIGWKPVPGTSPADVAFTVAESAQVQLTAFPYTVQTNGPTLTTTVEEGDPNNPFYNAVTSPNVLSFIFQLSNPSTTTGINPLTINGFNNWSGDIAYGNWTGSGTVLPAPQVQMTAASTGGQIDIPFGASSFKAPNGSTPILSVDVVLYTNATNYVAALDPVTWGSVYSAPSYAPAAATPEPSSMVLAAIGAVFLGLLGWRRNRA